MADDCSTEEAVVAIADLEAAVMEMLLAEAYFDYDVAVAVLAEAVAQLEDCQNHS